MLDRKDMGVMQVCKLSKDTLLLVAQTSQGNVSECKQTLVLKAIGPGPEVENIIDEIVKTLERRKVGVHLQSTDQ